MPDRLGRPGQGLAHPGADPAFAPQVHEGGHALILTHVLAQGLARRTGVHQVVAKLEGDADRLAGIAIWLGLAAGLAFCAVILTARFAMRDRLGLIDRRRMVAAA